MMRAHRRDGAGLYVPCRAGSVQACPYDADWHMEFESGVALMQYNVIECTGHDWDELQDRLPSLFWKYAALPSVMHGSEASDVYFDDALETIIVGDYVRDNRDTIASMGWSDPEAVLESIGWELWARSIRVYAAVAGVDDADMPAEIVAEDLPDACKGIGADRYMEQALEMMYDRHTSDYSVETAGGAISRDHDLARAFALAIGRAHGDLVPPEDAEPPAAPAIRVFDGRVRSEAAEQYPIAANRYADTLREVSNALEGAMKRCRGVRFTVGNSYGARIKPWSEADSEKRKIELTIRELRDAADRVRGSAGMGMGDARNAERAVSMLKGGMELAYTAREWRSGIGDGGDNDKVWVC